VVDFAREGLDAAIRSAGTAPAPGAARLQRVTLAPFATPANLAGQPSAVLPVSLTASGLPVAAQITGRPGADAPVLGVSKALEDAIGWAGLPE
jgi:Asp-tRNA(Asn)/Glu-tRNA(Gln) amidotransferase A subunit family amidase